MAKAAAKTGVSPTALIAIEQYFPEKQRIIEDDLAYYILPFGARALVWLVRPNWVRSWLIRATEINSPGIWGGMVCRKRYIDEKLTDSSNQIEAVVNLGAGFDTRAYRLPALYDIPVWEVDQLENIEAKQIRLLKVLGTIPSHVKLVAIDHQPRRSRYYIGIARLLYGQTDLFHTGSCHSISDRKRHQVNL